MKPRLQLQEFTSPQVFRLSTSKKGYGGIIYEKMLDAVLSSHFDYTVVSSAFGFKGFWRLLEMPKYLFLQWKFAKKPDGLRIRSFQSALFNFKGRGISIIYHVDSSGSAWLPRLYQDLTEWVFKAVIRKSEHIVVIAKYWQDYFRELGYTNVHLIYCGYALQDYVCSPQDEQEWRKRFQLTDKKIVYIGNPQVKKGALLAYEALKDSGYELVTSGVKAVEVPCRHLELSFKDYLCLLNAAEVVVLMSQFAEGWNRIAHEAMLMGSPVIGTGYGGMGEVLTGGGQEICTDPKKLPELVQKVISHRSEYSRHGLEYARKFSQEKFEDAWVSLVEKLKAH